MKKIVFLLFALVAICQAQVGGGGISGTTPLSATPASLNAATNTLQSTLQTNINAATNSVKRQIVYRYHLSATVNAGAAAYFASVEDDAGASLHPYTHLNFKSMYVALKYTGSANSSHQMGDLIVSFATPREAQGNSACASGQSLQGISIWTNAPSVTITNAGYVANPGFYSSTTTAKDLQPEIAAFASTTVPAVGMFYLEPLVLRNTSAGTNYASCVGKAIVTFEED